MTRISRWLVGLLFLSCALVIIQSALLFAQQTTPTTDYYNPYNPVTITLIGGQIVLIITTLGGTILAIITHVRVTTVKEQVATVKDQQVVNSVAIGTVVKDTEAIKGHVNSEKTASEGRIETLRRENQLLREHMQDIKSSAEMLAQAVAARPRTSRAGDAPGIPIDSHVQNLIAKIEENTAATATSVEKTAANVEAGVEKLGENK